MKKSANTTLPSEILKNSKAWLKKGTARNAAGTEVGILHKDAVSFSLPAATIKAFNGDAVKSFAALDKIRLAILKLTKKDNNITAWNDAETTTHKQLLTLLTNESL